MLKNSASRRDWVVAAVCDRRNSIACSKATLAERRYSEFFSNREWRRITMLVLGICKPMAKSRADN